MKLLCKNIQTLQLHKLAFPQSYWLFNESSPWGNTLVVFSKVFQIPNLETMEDGQCRHLTAQEKQDWLCNLEITREIIDTEVEKMEAELERLELNHVDLKLAYLKGVIEYFDCVSHNNNYWDPMVDASVDALVVLLASELPSSNGKNHCQLLLGLFFSKEKQDAKVADLKAQQMEYMVVEGKLLDSASPALLQHLNGKQESNMEQDSHFSIEQKEKQTQELQRQVNADLITSIFVMKLSGDAPGLKFCQVKLSQQNSLVFFTCWRIFPF